MYVLIDRYITLHKNVNKRFMSERRAKRVTAGASAIALNSLKPVYFALLFSPPRWPALSSMPEGYGSTTDQSELPLSLTQRVDGQQH